MASQAGLDTVQLIVSPQNPHKDASSLAREEDRLAMTRLAVRGNPKLSANSIEFNMPRPSYTINTLYRLREEAPDTMHKLILGSDSLAGLKQWKDWQAILDHFGCYVYPRPRYPIRELGDHPNVRIFETPLLDISATYIRDTIADGLSIRYLVPESVRHYIENNGLYRDKS